MRRKAAINSALGGLEWRFLPRSSSQPPDNIQTRAADRRYVNLVVHGELSPKGIVVKSSAVLRAT